MNKNIWVLIYITGLVLIVIGGVLINPFVGYVMQFLIVFLSSYLWGIFCSEQGDIFW